MIIDALRITGIFPSMIASTHTRAHTHTVQCFEISESWQLTTWGTWLWIHIVRRFSFVRWRDTLVAELSTLGRNKGTENKLSENYFREKNRQLKFYWLCCSGRVRWSENVKTILFLFFFFFLNSRTTKIELFVCKLFRKQLRDRKSFSVIDENYFSCSKCYFVKKKQREQKQRKISAKRIGNWKLLVV